MIKINLNDIPPRHSFARACFQLEIACAKFCRAIRRELQKGLNNEHH